MSQSPSWGYFFGFDMTRGVRCFIPGFWLLASGFRLLAPGFWLLASSDVSVVWLASSEKGFIRVQIATLIRCSMVRCYSEVEVHCRNTLTLAVAWLSATCIHEYMYTMHLTASEHVLISSCVAMMRDRLPLQPLPTCR